MKYTYKKIKEFLDISSRIKTNQEIEVEKITLIVILKKELREINSQFRESLLEIVKSFGIETKYGSYSISQDHPKFHEIKTKMDDLNKMEVEVKSSMNFLTREEVYKLTILGTKKLPTGEEIKDNLLIDEYETLKDFLEIKSNKV